MASAQIFFSGFWKSRFTFILVSRLCCGSNSSSLVRTEWLQPNRAAPLTAIDEDVEGRLLDELLGIGCRFSFWGITGGPFSRVRALDFRDDDFT